MVLVASAISLAAVSACSSSGKNQDGSTDTGSNTDTRSNTDTGPNTDAGTTVQYFTLSWKLRDAVSLQPLSCLQVNGLLVQVKVDTTMTFNLQCTAGSGMTGVVPPGSHSVAVTLVDALQANLSETPPMTFTLAPNVPLALPEITFDVN